MATNEEKTAGILNRLEALTAANKIDWVKTANERYVYSSDSASATISRDEFRIVNFGLQNSDGDTVANLSTVSNPELESTLRKLFVSAERIALRVDQTLDRFLKDLDL